MYCCHCGKERVEGKTDVCQGCGVPFSDNRAVRFCEHCGNHIIEGAEVCVNCGSNLLVPLLKDTSYKCSDMKAAAERLVNNRNVDKKMIYGLFYLLPLCVVMLIIGNITSMNHNFIQGKIMGYIVGTIVTAVCGGYVLLKTVEVIKTGKAKWTFKFDAKLSLAMLIVALVVGGINLLFTLLVKPDINLLHANNALLIELINFILLIVMAFVQWFFFFSFYIYLTRKLPMGESIKLGWKYGFKNLGRIILLGLSFIPLFILCCITFGILFIWKGFYISTTASILMEKVLQDNNI